MITVSIFDFDGTIANTIPAFISIFKKLGEGYGMSIEDETLLKLRDRPIKEIFHELNIPLIKLPFIARKSRKEFNKEVAHLKPIKGMKDLLLTLKKQGQTLGIVSSNSKESIKKFLEENDLQIFDFISTNNRVFGKAKSLKKIFKVNEYSKENAVYIGDEIRDIEAARKVGIKMISVTWGVNTRDGLSQYNPDFLVDSPVELLALYQNQLTKTTTLQ
jgi:HAD superfamily hydrolase (TIGR01549 family)